MFDGGGTALDQKMNHLIEVHERSSARMRQADHRLGELDAMLHTLGATFWRTDMHLRLLDSHGMMIAESFHGRLISDFYREAYGMDDASSPPMQAHRDARIGMSATLQFEHGGEQYLMLVEPRRNEDAEVIGTVGMSLRVGAGS